MTNFYALGKKGQESGLIFKGVIFIFIFGFLSILGYIYTNEIIGVYQASSFWGTTMSDVANGFLAALNLFDGLAVLFMIIFIIGIGVTSFRKTEPAIFFLITIILSVFYGAVSYFFNYIFAQMIAQDIFLSAIAHFPMTILICTNMHWLALATIVVGAITLYAKRPRGEFLT